MFSMGHSPNYGGMFFGIFGRYSLYIGVSYITNDVTLLVGDHGFLIVCNHKPFILSRSRVISMSASGRNSGILISAAIWNVPRQKLRRHLVGRPIFISLPSLLSRLGVISKFSMGRNGGMLVSAAKGRPMQTRNVSTIRFLNPEFLYVLRRNFFHLISFRSYSMFLFYL